MQLQQKGHFGKAKNHHVFILTLNRVFGVTTTRAQQFRIKFYLVKLERNFSIGVELI